jgi:hypothetical protein
MPLIQYELAHGAHGPVAGRHLSRFMLRHVATRHCASQHIQVRNLPGSPGLIDFYWLRSMVEFHPPWIWWTWSNVVTPRVSVLRRAHVWIIHVCPTATWYDTWHNKWHSFPTDPCSIWQNPCDMWHHHGVTRGLPLSWHRDHLSRATSPPGTGCWTFPVVLTWTFPSARDYAGIS